MTYLIVDDSGVTRKSLKGFFEEKGHICKTADNAMSALSILEKETFDIVITDFKMRGMNGIDLLKTIREKYSNTSVIVITGYAEVENAVDALNFGAKGFLQKPIDIHKLNNILSDIESENKKARTNDVSYKSGVYKKIALHSNWHSIQDPIKGVLNGELFLEYLAIKMKEKEKLAVITLKLDNFDFISNSLGFNAGTELILATVERIKECIERKDIFCQVRNDSFSILLTRLYSPDEPVLWARRFLQIMNSPISVSGQKLFAKTAMGIGLFPHHGEGPEELLKNVNTALQYAKKNGTESIQLYSQDIHKENQKRLAIESSMQNALDRNQFVLYYQPQVDLEHERIFGVESLIRWIHPDMGLVPPDEFIPVAEETGLIDPIGNWVIQTACRQFKEFQENGILLDKISVNISAHQLQGNSLYETVEQSLKETGIKPECLELELTETMLMENIDQAKKILYKIKSLKVSISLDDFGKGYSSLSYLKELPINTLKVDRSFVTSLLSNSQDASIMKAVIKMGRDLKFKVIAEGVEEREQLIWLKRHKCDAVQGYYFSRPLPVEEFKKYYFHKQDDKRCCLVK